MCRRLSTTVILSYSLRDRESITSEQLQEKICKIEQFFGDVVADVSFSSIRESVAMFNDMIEMRVDSCGFSVCRKDRIKGRAKNHSNEPLVLFDETYACSCVSPYYTTKDFNEIKRILAAL